MKLSNITKLGTKECTISLLFSAVACMSPASALVPHLPPPIAYLWGALGSSLLTAGYCSGRIMKKNSLKTECPSDPNGPR